MTKDFELVKLVVDEFDWEEIRAHKKELVAMTIGPIAAHLTADQINAILTTVGNIELLQEEIARLEFLPREEIFGYHCIECGRFVEKDQIDKYASSGLDHEGDYANDCLCKKCMLHEGHT